MSEGVKVLVKTKIDDGSIIEGYGYIVNRINAHFYDIWMESSQTVITVHKNDFIEIVGTNTFLYEMRDKSR